jgi:hypothetical protein
MAWANGTSAWRRAEAQSFQPSLAREQAAVLARVILIGGNHKPELILMNNILKLQDNLPATDNNPWSEIAAERGNQTLLKYVKGVWSVADEQVPLGTKYLAFIDLLERGFIKFNEDGAPEVHLGKVKFGKDKLPKRHDLGDLDQDDWEIVDGKSMDPWQQIFQLPLSPIDRFGELVVFSAIGEKSGARSAVLDLCGIYSRSPRHGYLPIIELGTSSYKHKKYGTVHVPVLKLASWHQVAPVIESDPAPSEADYGAAMDDAIPF